MKQESEQFKIEATPVIDLKKAPVSDVWDNEKTEVYLEDEGGNGAAFLLTSEGDYIPISAFPFVIGRGNECDLVLNRKGISRKHAEIVFQSGRFVVNDLDSLNGLKVNGYKVARVILEEGDSIKLGEVSLVFTSTKSASDIKGSESAASSQAQKTSVVENIVGASSVGKKIIYAVAGVSLLVIVGAGVFMFAPNFFKGVEGQKIVSVPNPSTTANTQETTVDASVNATQQPTGVVSDAAPVETSIVDPTAPPPSIAFNQSATSTENLMPPPLSKPDPISVEKPIKKVATPKPVVIAKPVTAPKPVAKVVEAIKSSGTSTTSFDSSSIDSRYLSGNVDSLLKEMSQAINSTKAADALYRNKYNSIVSMYNKYTAGKQAFIEGRKADAVNQWSIFLKEENAIFGNKRSVMATAAMSKVIDEYLVLGNEAAKVGNHHSAYKYWQKSLSYGDSVAARIALDAANQKSKQLYRQALRLEYVNTEKAKSLWQQVIELVPPGTEYHTKASSKLAWYDKWGA